MSRFKLPVLTSRVWKVWRRNFDVFLKTWHVNFLPSLLEPILYLAAFGLGLGVLITGSVDGGSYLQFIGPGLVAIAVMYGAFFECTYASFVRMYFQKTFDAIVATPVSVEEVIAGELLWGATRAAINASIVLVVVAGFGLVSSMWVLLVPALAFFGGLLFAALAMCFTAIAPDIDFFNFPTFLFITPMFLLSGTFFPLGLLPTPLQVVAFGALPLTHIVNLSRTLILGRTEQLLGFSTELMLALNVLWIVVVTLVFFLLAIMLMKKRLIK
ncbi:MAG: ABC transporter permease [Candidatus Bathyarchaeota archaeon]|nr:ABC transporter permease [Candidatus Bathyarchaeota archaeon]